MRAILGIGLGMVMLGALAGCSSDGSGSTGSDGGLGVGNGSGGGSGIAGASGQGGRRGGGKAGATSGKAGAASGAGGSIAPGDVVTYGEPYDGGEFHLGPVDWEETEWHNACAPLTKYASIVRQAEGTLLAGIWNGIRDTASYCDACIYVSTAEGKSALLRVVTYGDTTANSIDVSPDAYDILNSGEYPRSMTWQFAKCADTGKIMYEFQTGSSEWWTSLWVRNARVPITQVEVQSVNHGSYVTMSRGSDGTLTDASGFGAGAFSIRLTGMDGQEIVDGFDWPGSGIAGQMLTGQGNFE